MKPEAVERAVLELPGFSTKTTNAFMRGLPDFKKFLNALPDTVTYVVPKEKKPASSKLAGLFVVFTGFRDADLAEVVKSNGGVYADSLTGKVNMLVVKSAGSSSSKVKTAKSKGIEILTRDEFIKFLKSKKVL
jgi:NAD-dependent DNA ligase